MPRVSQEYRDQRRRQILSAARRCFIREGFHQTSMADIFAETGLSAGSVYVYFKSKSDIIAAIAGEVIEQVTELLEPIATQDPPPPLHEAVLRGLTATEEIAFGEEGFARLAPQVWAEALRDDALAEVVHERYGTVRGIVSRLVAAEQKAGRVSPGRDPDDVAKVLFGVILGYIVQRLLVGDVDPRSYSAGLAAIVQAP